jgi:ligand-binding SRPBCC domain-containing protein
MDFNITDWDKRKAYPGQIIQYTVRPVLGFKINWVTEITQVKDKEFFIDEQRFGPYSFWHHKHFIKEIEGGVEMEDIVDYKIPFGILGQIAHVLFVKNKLKEIFKYRKNKLNELFGKI